MKFYLSIEDLKLFGSPFRFAGKKKGKKWLDFLPANITNRKKTRILISIYYLFQSCHPLPSYLLVQGEWIKLPNPIGFYVLEKMEHNSYNFLTLDDHCPPSVRDVLPSGFCHEHAISSWLLNLPSLFSFVVFLFISFPFPFYVLDPLHFYHRKRIYYCSYSSIFISWPQILAWWK